MNFKAIEERAGSLLDEFSRLTGWIKKAPVPVVQIAETYFNLKIGYEEEVWLWGRQWTRYFK